MARKLTPPKVLWKPGASGKFSFGCGKSGLNLTLITILTMIKYTTPFLAKLEDMIAESNYVLRYEKGQFKSGYCILRDQNIIIINKFYSVEGKINALLDILRTVELDTSKFSEKNKNLHDELVAADTSVNK